MTTMQFYRRPLPDTCIDFSSSEGKKIFQEAVGTGYMDRYFKLAAQFRTQDHPAFCGPSTLVMCLNTLEIDPGRVWKGPWRWYHESMLDCCVPMDNIRQEGLLFEEFVCLADCNGLDVHSVRCTEEIAIDGFRKKVQESCQQEEEVLVLSYSRKIVKQTGDGHFTTVGGYHPDRDLVLIMDCARFKYPPHWVSLDLVFDALKAVDKLTQKPRGYMTVRPRQGATSLLVFKICSTFSQLMLTQGQEIKDGTAAAESLANSKPIIDFIQAYEKWLKEEPAEGEEDMMRAALLFLIRTFEEVGKNGQFIFSVQRDFQDKPEHSHDSSCSIDHHDNIIDELLGGIRAMPAYEYAKELFSSSKARIVCCQDKEAISAVENPAMFLMFVLSWPNKLCGKTRGKKLLELTQAAMEKAPQSLKGEVEQLKKQISVIYGRYKSCHCAGKC